MAGGADGPPAGSVWQAPSASERSRDGFRIPEDYLIHLTSHRRACYACSHDVAPPAELRVLLSPRPRLPGARVAAGDVPLNRPSSWPPRRSLRSAAVPFRQGAVHALPGLPRSALASRPRRRRREGCVRKGPQPPGGGGGGHAGRGQGGGLHRRRRAGAGGSVARGARARAARGALGMDARRPGSARALEESRRSHRRAAAASARSAQRHLPEARMIGLVSLVGAGPGDPELLTLRAVSRLRAADLVLYDALVDRAALRHAPQARWASAGKRKAPPPFPHAPIPRVIIPPAL